VGGVLGLITLRMVGGIISAGPTPPVDWLKDWNPAADDAFCNLGKRIAAQSRYAGSADERMRFAAERMREAAGRFNLRAAEGGWYDNALVCYYRHATS